MDEERDEGSQAKNSRGWCASDASCALALGALSPERKLTGRDKITKFERRRMKVSPRIPIACVEFSSKKVTTGRYELC